MRRSGISELSVRRSRGKKSKTPLMRKIRYLDRLIDELPKAKSMEKNRRQGLGSL